MLQAQSHHLYKIDSTNDEISFRTFCKNYLVFSKEKAKAAFERFTFRQPKNNFKISGNVLYDVNYRSLIDTPFAARDFVQHYLQTNLNFVVADKYPLQVILSSRRSNSGYFKDYYDVSFRFNQQEYNQSIKDKLKASLQNKYKEQLNATQFAYQQWEKKASELRNLNTFIESPKQIQRLIEAKEFLERKKLPTLPVKPPSFKKDVGRGELQKQRNKFQSSAEAQEVIAAYQTKKTSLDSIRKQAEKLQKDYVAKKQQVTKKIDSLQQRINAAANANELRKLNRAAYDSLSKREKFLLGLKTVLVGRSIVNYSELSVKNISIGGANVEYNANYYWAVAAGTIDYRFRDYIVREDKAPKQYVGLVRFGKGDVNNDHVIFTAYKGRKNNYHFSSLSAAQQNIYGLTIESRYQIAPDHSIIMEAAKSSALSKDTRGGVRKTVLDFADPTTTALSAKLSSYFKTTHTRISGTYRYMGANFQSFTLYNSSADQTSWNLSLDQYLFKRVIGIKASIRKNEFENPYAVANYESNVVFKSFFLSFRKRRLPYLSVGYLPTTQLTKIDNQLYQNQFYMLVATASHFYKLGGLYCTALATGSRYYSSGNDLQSVYANSKNLMLSHTVTSKNTSIVTTVSNSVAPEYRLVVFDQGINFSWANGFSAGGGLKLNQLNKEREQLGYYGNLVLPLKYLGDVSISYESNYLPGNKNTLVSNDMGRITYYKRF